MNMKINKTTIVLVLLIVSLAVLTRIIFVGKEGFFAKEESSLNTESDTVYKRGPIKEKCDTTYAFENGVARIRLKGKYSLIDKAGQEITTVKYDDMSRFDHGVACVKINGKWGVINKKGEEVTPLKYDFMQETNTFVVRWLKGGNKMILLDEDYKPIECNPLGYFSDRNSYFDESGIAKVCLNGKWGFIDKSGKEISKIKYDYVFFFSEGMARVLLNNKWGFINESGEEVIPLIYDFDDEELREKSPCEIGESIEENEKGQPVYLDKEGKSIDYDVLEFINEQHTYFNHGLVAVYYANIHDIYNDSYSETQQHYKRPKYIFLDKKGEEVKSKKYDRFIDEFYNYGRTKMNF